MSSIYLFVPLEFDYLVNIWAKSNIIPMFNLLSLYNTTGRNSILPTITLFNLHVSV